MTTIANRDRILASLHGEVPDAVGIAEMIFWPETAERWWQEGLPHGVDPGAHFGVDALCRSIATDLTLQMTPRVVEEDEHSIVRVNANGVKTKEKKGSYTPPVEIGATVCGREDWLKLKPRMLPDDSRLPQNFQALYDRDRAAHSVLLYKNPDPCWAAFKVLGFENMLLAIADDPGFLQELFSIFTELIIGLHEILACKGLRFDVAWFNSDVCYRSGMLFSPRFYERWILPFHRRLTDYFRERSMPTVFHTCGNVQQLLPLYIKAGVRALHPLEARAGNDVREFCRLYGDRMVFIGNINADRLGSGKGEIEAEIRSKLTLAKQSGAYVFHSDHSIPPTVSLNNYRYALELAQEYGRIRQ